MNWADYIDSFNLNSPILYVVKYEDLLHDGFNTLRAMVNWLQQDIITDEEIEKVLEAYSFKNITGRDAGKEDSSQFLRKGIAGDWKNKFTEAASERFDKWAKP